MLGRTIKEERKKKNLSGEQLGNIVNITKQQVSQLENGSVQKPDPQLIVRISDALDSERIRYAYLNQNPVFLAVRRRTFPELNNIRKELPSICAKVTQEAKEVVEVGNELSDIFLNVEFREIPEFEKKLIGGLEQMLDAKRAIEELENRLVFEKILSRENLERVYDSQQEKCERKGHHKPSKEVNTICQ